MNTITVKPIPAKGSDSEKYAIQIPGMRRKVYLSREELETLDREIIRELGK